MGSPFARSQFGQGWNLWEFRPCLGRLAWPGCPPHSLCPREEQSLAVGEAAAPRLAVLAPCGAFWGVGDSGTAQFPAVLSHWDCLVPTPASPRQEGRCCRERRAEAQLLGRSFSSSLQPPRALWWSSRTLSAVPRSQPPAGTPCHAPGLSPEPRLGLGLCLPWPGPVSSPLRFGGPQH